MILKTRKIKIHTLAAALVFSQLSHTIPLVAMAADGDVRIAGQTIFTTQAGSDGGSASSRAETIQNNLDNAIVAAQDRTPSSVGITYVKGMPVITFGGYQVVSITSQDAQAANTTPAQLAQQWADSIKSALGNRSSIDSYVAQLTGGYSAGGSHQAPPIPDNANHYDSYNSSGPAPPNNYSNNLGSPQNGQYGQGGGGSGQGYAQAGGGYGGGGYQQGGTYQQGGNYQQQGGPYQGGPQGYRQGRIAYAPAGQVIPITLQTSISTQVARSGDLIEANITQNVNLGDSVIPAGSVVIGQVSNAEAGRRLTRSGELQIKFNRIRTPDGTETPISAHLVGGVGKFKEVGGDQSDTFRGEGMGNKVGSVAFRGLIGAGGGAALGTAVGAIAGGGHGAGAGAWSGTAIGGGLGVADSLLLRKGKDVTVRSGTQMQLQLDAPVSVAGAVPSGGGYGGQGGGY